MENFQWFRANIFVSRKNVNKEILLFKNKFWQKSGAGQSMNPFDKFVPCMLPKMLMIIMHKFVLLT